MSDHPSVHELMGRVLAAMPAVGKNGTAPANQGGYKFRGIEDTLAALKKPMADHGVFVMPTVLDFRPSERMLSSGKAMYCMTLLVKFTFYGPAGDSVEAVTVGEGTDMGDKATQKALTAAFKYCLFETFLVGDEAADAEAHDVPDTAGARSTAPRRPRTFSAKEAKTRIYAAFRDSGLDKDAAKTAAEAAWNLGESSISEQGLQELIAGLDLDAGRPFTEGDAA